MLYCTGTSTSKCKCKHTKLYQFLCMCLCVCRFYSIYIFPFLVSFPFMSIHILYHNISLIKNIFHYLLIYSLPSIIVVVTFTRSIISFSVFSLASFFGISLPFLLHCLSTHLITTTRHDMPHNTLLNHLSFFVIISFLLVGHI